MFMNLKIFVLAVVILISLVGAAYTVNTQKSPQTSYNLTYNFEKGDKFNYKSVSSIEKPKKYNLRKHRHFSFRCWKKTISLFKQYQLPR